MLGGEKNLRKPWISMVAEASENLGFRSTFSTSELKPFKNKGFRYLPEPMISMVSEIFLEFFL